MDTVSPSVRGPGSRDAYWQPVAASKRGSHSHVTVIGAGIVGLATAAALSRSGRAVTVIDAAQSVGQGASFGNGCQLAYAYVAPLAQPGVIRQLPELMLARDPALRIAPRLDPRQWRWLLQFLGASRPEQARRGTLALLELGRVSRRETDLWLEGADREALGFAENGKLVLLPNATAFDKAKAQVALQASHGPGQRVLDPGECLALEPSLERFRGRIAGGVFTPTECVVESLALCRDVEASLRERGVQFEMGVEVTGCRSSRDRVTHLLTTAGPREVDAVVLATGSQTAAVACKLGFALPVYPLKGYSISARIVDRSGVPRASVTDASKKVVFAPVGDVLRVAGVVEVAGYDTAIDGRRIDALIRSTREAFGDAVDLQSVSPWAGLRPATPSSVPIIGASPVSNVLVNVGHGGLGLTLAFGSACRLAEVTDA